MMWEKLGLLTDTGRRSNGKKIKVSPFFTDNNNKKGKWGDFLCVLIE